LASIPASWHVSVSGESTGRTAPVAATSVPKIKGRGVDAFRHEIWRARCACRADVACGLGSRNARRYRDRNQDRPDHALQWPVSAFGALGKGEVGYFKMLNERGGINGRKVNLISLDDGYAPPKTVEQTRRPVESDEVALIFSSIGTAHNTAIAKYLQSKNIPQLFIGSGASKFADIAQYPQATLGVQGPFRYEARLYARYALAKNPNAKFAVISQNDDFGRDYLLGLKDVLGENTMRSLPARPTKSRIRPSTSRSSG
jgi:hypothetical protein